MKQHILELEAAFPKYELKLDAVISENDWVAVRAFFKGVHLGDFKGIPPTNKTVKLPVMLFYKIDESKIVKFFMSFDRMELMEQLGVTPFSDN